MRASGPGWFDVDDRTAHRMQRVAVVQGSVVVALLVALAAGGAMPRNPDGDWFRPVEGPAQFALLVLVAVGLALSRRFTAVAAVLIAFAGAGLAVIAAIGYPPSVALVVAIAFLVPAVLLWVAWQRHETPMRIVALAVGTGLLLGASWVGAEAVYDRYFGPTHLESSTAAVDDPLVEWAWSGAATPEGFTVVMHPRRAASVVTLEVWQGQDDVDVDPPAARIDSPVTDDVARLRVDGLLPGTTYRYRFLVDGERAPDWSGTTATMPERLEVGERITIATASCARTGSNGAVYDAIRSAAPNLYINTGDLHYADVARNDVVAFTRTYDKVLTAPAQAALYRSLPIAYVWDDHDYGTNDSDASAPSRPAARQAYERTVPHHPLADETTINQAFSVGPVRVVLLDTRSAREPGSTMLGADQLAWLERELRTAAPVHDLIVLVSPTPWIGAASDGSDTWAGFADERRAVSDLIAEHASGQLVIVSGDAHMVAIDDGSNSDYSSSGNAAVPVFQAAALDRPGNVKGGPYSEGAVPGGGQFGLIEVVATADGVEVTLEGRRYDGTVLVTHQFVTRPDR